MIEEDALFGEVSSAGAEGALPGGTNRQSAAWDVRQAPKNYLALIAAQAFTSLLSFASVWLATHHLGPAGYGGVVAFIAASQMVMLVAVNWTSVSVARFGCEEFIETGKVRVAFWNRLVVLIPNLLLVVLTAPIWLPRLAGILQLPPNSIWLVLSLIVANAWWIHIQQSLQGVKLMRLQGWLLTFERALIFSALIFLAISGRMSVWIVGWLYVIGPVGASSIGLFKLARFIWPISGIDRTALNRMLRFSIPIIPTAFIGYLATNYLDALFITHFLSQAKLGIYSVAYQLAGLTQQLPLLAGTLLMPLFVTLQTGKREDQTERFIREILPSTILIWTTICAILAAVGSYLLPLIFGARFQEAALLLWPLMAASALAGPSLMGYTPITTSTAKTYIQMIGVSLGSCTNVALDLVLIPRFGLLGCAWATTAAYGIHLIVVFILVHRRIIPKPTWILQATLPIIAGALCASWFRDNVVALIVSIVIGGLVALVNRKSLVSALSNLFEYGRGVFKLRTRVTPAQEPL